VLAEARFANCCAHWDVQASLPAAPGQRHMLQGARSDGDATAADGWPQAVAAPQRSPPAAVSAAALEELRQLQVLPLMC
jgi:hypothetical protein